MSAKETKPYSVDFWGDTPVETDTCWYGQDFDTKEEALNHYNASCSDKEVQFIVVDGPDIHEERKNPTFIASTGSDDDDWIREQAMLAGMMGGCEAYNEVMGF